ncbi:unnamed protein product [Psylliodes chrysocephalus]|uniref:Uncharacterized protein n=1 Tax=Psylliodes chrysocephalus TaxID=3402493 RepID=A0A9P0D3N4_9CUCU|nr:unnamed protein product [Psylliodes chrysocephala]
MATIHIRSGKSNLDCNNRKLSNIQSVPFKIHADCDANVNKYFNNYIKTDEKGQTSASFRGYPLKGKPLGLPEGYVGVVLHESVKPETEKCERKFYVTYKFSKIHYWNWDKAPSDNDSIVQALQWMDIAEALHSPILEE